MIRTHSWLQGTNALLTSACGALLASACGSVHGADNRGEPIAVVTATLSEAPPDVGQTGPLRAALVWTNGLGLGGAFAPGCAMAGPDMRVSYQDCQTKLQNTVQVTTSDVQVEMEFPLTVKLAMYDLPTPIVQHIENPDYQVAWADGTMHALSGDFYSLPEAEVVLYEDGNDNHQLDLLPVGQPGPGPDRVVALSSGMDDNGDAVRTAVVYKAGTLPFWIGPYAPLVDDTNIVPDAAPVPNGIYTYREAFHANNGIQQQRMLKMHALTGPDAPFGEDIDDMQVTPATDSTIKLFAVSDAHRSWLSRGCQRMVSLGAGFAVAAPPAGADVQCGASAFAFASNPDNYCGQTEIDILSDAALPDGKPDWWPCDEHGLKPGTPYQPAKERFDGDATAFINLSALGFGNAIAGSLDWRCHKGVIYHFDQMPFFRMPTVAPTPGTQVMCHSSEAFSSIPARADGCLYEYRSDLASDPTWPNTLDNVDSWDLRASKPDWWPCDENGQLRADSGMVPPAPIDDDADCEGFNPHTLTAVAPPEGSAIRCDSAGAFRYVPPWSDACDPKTSDVLQYSDETSTGSISKAPWWPCDDDGAFIPSAHFVEMQ